MGGINRSNSSSNNPYSNLPPKENGNSRKQISSKKKLPPPPIHQPSSSGLIIVEDGSDGLPPLEDLPKDFLEGLGENFDDLELRLKQISELSQQVERSQAKLRSGTNSPRVGLQHIGLSTYGILTETHSVLDFSFLEKISPLIGAFSNILGIFVGASKFALGAQAAWMGAVAYKEANTSSKKCKKTLHEIKNEVTYLEGEFDRSQEKLNNLLENDSERPGYNSNDNSNDKKRIKKQISDIQYQLEELLRIQETAESGIKEAAAKMSAAKLSVLLGGTKASSGVVFSSASVLKLGVGLATLGSKIPAAEALHLAGSILGRLASGIAIALSLVNMLRLATAMTKDQEDLEKIAAKREQLAAIRRSHLDNNILDKFVVLENKQLDLEQASIIARHRLHLLSLGVNTLTLLGSIAALSAGFVAAPSLSTLLGVSSIAFIGLAVSGELYVLIIERRSKRELMALGCQIKETNLHEIMTGELKKAIENKDTTYHAALREITRYFEPKDKREFSLKWSGFLQARYGKLEQM